MPFFFPVVQTSMAGVSNKDRELRQQRPSRRFVDRDEREKWDAFQDPNVIHTMIDNNAIQGKDTQHMTCDNINEADTSFNSTASRAGHTTAGMQVDDLEITAMENVMHPPTVFDQDYEARWKPESNGPVSLCIFRKNGPHKSTHIDNTMPHLLRFHREYGFPNRKNCEDHLCNDMFLTGSPAAATIDTLKTPRNRFSLDDNSEDPFCLNERPQHTSRMDHLDRTCKPRMLSFERDTIVSGKRRFGHCVVGHGPYTEEEDVTIYNKAYKTDPLAVSSSTINPPTLASPRRYRGRAPIIAPWTQCSSFL